MDELSKGSWIINTVKHTSEVKTNTIELVDLEATERAGKCGLLLSKLMADSQEIIDDKKLKVFARQAYISPEGINSCIEILKQQGQVDYSKDHLDRIKEVEIYCFSKDSAIETTAHIFDTYEPSPIELANIYTLKETFELPRTKEEIINKISTQGKISEKDVANILELQDTFSLIKKELVYGQDIYYNEYAFQQNGIDISKALIGLDAGKRNEVNEVLRRVSSLQGCLDIIASKDIDPNILAFMEGIGLLDGISVESEFGNAVFYMTPQVKGIGIGKHNSLSIDIFNKAKLLLSCLRYGEYKSMSSRGAIQTQSKLANIINKLLRGEWVGPCTAIGEDYKLLEKEGVISVMPYSNMYKMLLRQKEVGQLVKQMVDYGKLIDADSDNNNIFAKLPTSYVSPEERRKQIQPKKTKPIRFMEDSILTAIRTGGSFNGK